MAKIKTDKTTSEAGLKNLKGFLQKASKVKKLECISTGHLELDLALIGVDMDSYDPDKHKDGGFPLGRIVEISGAEGSGKSSEAYRVVGNAQKMGLNCAWIDAEHSFSEDLATINGVDLDNLQISKLVDTDDPEHIYSAEEIFDNINKLCAEYKVIVLDSIATLVPKSVLENELSEGGVGLAAIAGVLSRAMPKLLNYAEANGTLIILINQLREKIGSYVPGEYTPGGRAAKHAYTIQIRLRKQTDKTKGPIYIETENKDKPLLVGNHSFVYITKNRLGKPVESDIRIPIYYQPYFPASEDIIFNEGRKLKIISKYLADFRWNEIKAQGKNAFINAVKEKNLLSQLVDQIKETAKASGSILPPEIIKFQADIKSLDNSKINIKSKDADEDTDEEEDAVKVHRARQVKNSKASSKGALE